MQPSVPQAERRISITKLQRDTAAAIELISLCQTVTEDGRVSKEEVAGLRSWLDANRETDLPAIGFLSATVEQILADGIVTDAERAELYSALERVLPPDIRAPVTARRKLLEREGREKLRADAAAARDFDTLKRKEERERNRPVSTFDFMVAGVRHEGRPAIISRYVIEEDPAVVRAEPSNRFSRNAVGVFTTSGHMIGYIPEEYAREVAPLLGAGYPWDAYFKKVLTDGRVPIPVVVVRFYGQDSDVPGTSSGATSAPTLRILSASLDTVGVKLIGGIIVVAVFAAILSLFG